jgi:hypothetical protein
MSVSLAGFASWQQGRKTHLFRHLEMAATVMEIHD